MEALILDIGRVLIAKAKVDLDLCSTTNINVAHFLCECFATMDRGYVMVLAQLYVFTVTRCLSQSGLPLFFVVWIHACCTGYPHHTL